MKKFYLVPASLIVVSFLTVAQENSLWNSIIGSAFTNNQSYIVLQRICDEAGGRLIGTKHNERALEILKEELTKIGLVPRFESFEAPGWIREDDEVVMLNPMERKLKSTPLGYVNKHLPINTQVVFASYGFEENYQNLNAKGKIVLVTQERPHGKTPLFRYEAIDIAAKFGAAAILFINEKPGMLLIVGVSNFQGNPSPIPAYSITYEEGKWMERLINRSVQVTLKIKTNSYCKRVQSSNVIVTFPGKRINKIVVGAHIDSWDLGQGGVDNGQGTAILFEVAHLLKSFSPQNEYTIELVWFNGEELGLWGSKHYVKTHLKDSIAAMINLDMTGSPTGFNAMGYDEFVPFLKELVVGLNGFNLKDSVISNPWTNSDYEPFMLAGIPTFTVLGYLDAEDVRYYHDAGDTFDKVEKKYISESSAVVTILTQELANNTTIPFRRRTERETVDLMKKFKIDETLKRQKEWPFGD